MAKASKPMIGGRHRLDTWNDGILGSAVEPYAGERSHRVPSDPTFPERTSLDPSPAAARSGAKLAPSASLADFSLPQPPTPLYDLNVAADQVKEGAAAGGAKAGDLVGITAHSTDPNGGQITYKIISDGSKGGFAVDAKSGVITVKDAAKLDFETASSHQYKLMVEARDWDDLFATKTFIVTLANVNEAPGGIVDVDAATNTVAENAVAGTLVGITAKSTDPDAGDVVTYNLTDDASGRFQIDAASGVVSVKAGAVLDFEAAASHTIKVQAKDAAGLLSPVQSFTINLGNVSEGVPGPIMDTNAAANAVAENAVAGTLVGITAKSIDPDAGDAITYSLTDDAGGRFQIDAASGVISVKAGAVLDFEVAASHAIKVQAKDSGGLLSPLQSFTIALTNVNEAPGPIADANAAANAVAESAASGTPVGITAKSIDPDAGDAITYSLTDDAGGRFQIDAVSGIVSVKAGAVLDFEAAASHAIKVQAKDAAGLLSPVQSFTVSLGNVNETPGPIADANAAANAVAEGAAFGTLVGITAKSTDPDAGDAITYSLADDAGGRFQIDAVTGVVSVKNGALLDYDKATSHTITVKAMDAGALFSIQAYVIAVIDVIGNNLDIDLATLPATAGFRIDGAAANDLSGSSVAAGDVNGDGFGDLIVGAPHVNPNGKFFAGATYVIFGKSAGFSTIDLANLPAAAGFRIDGAAAGDQSGFSVAASGDVNGDGFGDLIIGAFSATPTDAGSSYVIFGKSAGFSTINLAALPAAAGFRIDGAAASDFSGFSVAAAGDVNGDGFADLIVGASGADPNGKSAAGSSYVLFGKAAGFSTINLAALPAADGFRIDGAAAQDQSGIAVAAAGDVNGDGFGDLLVGSYVADPNGKNSAGSSYVIFGKATGFSTIDLAALPVAAGFRIDGGAAFDKSGRSVATAGDINGDGFDELIIGATFADPSGKVDAGSSYVIFGKGAGFSDIDLAALPAIVGFRIDGAAADDESSVSVAPAGDVNGDGFDELIIGADFVDPSGKVNAGAAYVIFGRSSGFSDIDLANLPAAVGFRIGGAVADDRSGRSAATAGDVNGDGFGDLIVGAYRADPNGKNYAGSSYVIFGSDLSGSVTHQGAAGNDSLAGTVGADVMVGGLGDDALAGAGGADVIKGGGGNDAISVGDADFFRIDGGGGSDSLTFAAASGLVIAAGSLRARIEGVETLDFTNGQNDTVALSKADLLSFAVVNHDLGGNAALDNVLTIEGNAGDALSLTGGGWAQSALTLAGYTVFANNALLVAVDNDFGAVTLG